MRDVHHDNAETARLRQQVGGLQSPPGVASAKTRRAKAVRPEEAGLKTSLTPPRGNPPVNWSSSGILI